jgi:formate-dependent phosphoribosylglycinamide formyltransferase (GAR transformylase)
MKKVLLAGTSYSATPILYCLREYGHHIAVCGALPEDPCHTYADSSYAMDYAQRELLLEVVRREQMDYLCPSCNDYSYMACTWVAEQCGLPGYDPIETAMVLHTKSEFRRFLEKHHFPGPRVTQASEALDKEGKTLALPVLVKPVDSFSGRGVTKVTQATDVATAIHTARKSSHSVSISSRHAATARPVPRPGSDVQRRLVP